MITVDTLRFSYTRQTFIRDLSFAVAPGEIFGFLGPSGAGKSTLQKILTGLLPGYRGQVIVNGTDIRRRKHPFYEQIGVCFEFPSLYEKLTGLENLRFFAALYARSSDPERWLERVGLQNDGNKKVAAYSKGMKTRLNLIKALQHDPLILFLDEPTSGLDPTHARQIKEIILEQKAQGKTIILTTHNMHDATELCDRVAFIVDGKLRALDTPHNLIMSRGAGRIAYTYLADGREIHAEVPLDQTADDTTLLGLLGNNQLRSIHSSEPTLEDIFVELTGRQLL
jgi:fluoroquinolone transport system ATP-binding protein